jgi:hypothetical protein
MGIIAIMATVDTMDLQGPPKDSDGNIIRRQSMRKA